MTTIRTFGLLAITTFVTSCRAAPSGPIAPAPATDGATLAQIAQVSGIAAAAVSGTAVPIPVGPAVLPLTWTLAMPNGDGTLNDPIQWPIPNTDKRIDFTQTNAALPTSTLLMCLLQASEDILDAVVDLGKDGFISDGKFVSQFINVTDDFVVISVQDQVSRDQRITYGTLDIVLRGMGQFMASQNAFFEADFNIFDGQWGQVGYGSLVGSHFA